MKLVFLGAPGAGKGTIAKMLNERKGFVHISTGDLFRLAIKNQTELGKKVSQILERGDLVPDELTISIVKEKTNSAECKKGYILDGFPRTIVQAEEWEKVDPVDMAVLFDVTDDLVRQRLGGRRICPKCGAIYNIYTNRPKKENTCDIDGETLIIRKDDQIDAINNRLKVYHEQTEPLIDYYKKLNKLVVINAGIDAETSYNEVLKLLKL